jgi:hypothetical protein
MNRQRDVVIDDDLQDMGAGDLGPPGNVRVREDNRPCDTIYDIPNLHPHTIAIRDLAYELGKVGKTDVACFHLHYFLISYYCHVAQAQGTQVIDIPANLHCQESIETHELLLHVLSEQDN